MAKEINYKCVPESVLYGNYYGGLLLAEHEGCYYWAVENYNTDFTVLDPECWREIPKNLYDEILKHVNAGNNITSRLDNPNSLAMKF